MDICLVCGKEFKQNQGAGRQREYCSDLCRRAANYTKVKGGSVLTCPVCRKEFEQKLGRGRPGKCCSRICSKANDYANVKAGISGRRLVTKTCAGCGIIFETRNKGRKYCSRKCTVDATKTYGGSILACPVCGKDYPQNHKDQKYCSPECHGISLRKPAEEKLRTNRIREKTRKRTDPAFALKCRVRVLMYHSLRGNKGGRKWQDLIGYSVEDLRRHLEKKFTSGMTWERFMDGQIHVDHKVPVAVHNITSTNDPDFKKCWALKNLQPLWWYDNLSKHDRIDQPFQPSLAIGG